MPIPVLRPQVAAAGLRVDLDGLAFNQGAVDDNGVQHHLGSLDGWDSPALREDLAERPLAHGAFRGTSYYGVREIGLKGTLVSPNGLQALRAAKDRLAEACDLTDVDGVLTVAETPAKQARVRRSGRLRYAQAGGHLLRWELDLTAIDPRKYGTVDRTLSLQPGTSKQALNAGRFRGGAPLLVTFRGPLTSPALSIAGVSLALTTVGSGERVVVDTLEGTVLLAGAGTAYSRLTSSGPFPTLPPNASTAVSLSGSGAGSVDLAWRDTWV